MRDVLGKMRECGKYIKMRDFPHDCGMVDTYVGVTPPHLRTSDNLFFLLKRHALGVEKRWL